MPRSRYKKLEGADPTDLMAVGTDLVAHYINRIEHHAANTKADIATLTEKACTDATTNFRSTVVNPFDYGVFKEMIFGGVLKYVEKLGRLDDQVKKHVSTVVSAVATGVAAASGHAPIAAAIVGAGVGSLGTIITNYLMKQRDLRSAGLRLIGAFLADWRRDVRANPSLLSLRDWEEAKNGLELSLLCAGLR